MRNICHTYYIIFITTLCACLCSACSSHDDEHQIVTRLDSASYGLGVAFAEKIPQNLIDNQIETVDFNYFLQGIVDYFQDSTNLQLSKTEVEKIIDGIFGQRERDKQQQYIQENEKNIADGQAFMDKNKENDDVITLSKGLQYKIIDLGWGRLSPILTDTIYISFKIYNTKNELLYNSKQKYEQTKIYLGNAIPALQKVLPLIKTGGNVRIYTSHEYAYGSVAYQNELVKPYESLIIDVKLTKIRLSSERLAEYNKIIEQENKQNLNIE